MSLPIETKHDASLHQARAQPMELRPHRRRERRESRLRTPWPFKHTFAQVRSISVTGSDGEAVEVVPLRGRPSCGYAGFANKVRFACLAEDRGRRGSVLYFNDDMVGSTPPVYAGDNPGDLVRRAAAQGLPSWASRLLVFSPEDPCYQLACDTISNVDLETLTTNAKTAVVVAANMALSLDGVPRRTKTTRNTRSKNHVRAQFDKWKRKAEYVSAEKSCSHKEKSTI
ncbi:hypothetical protein GGR53DRAFT_469794 [Hypoxylon sp. FL1150]|nr:hypothetical protein GGR53DRAFT_469794 [Hypoxylon sp. FL1150]